MNLEGIKRETVCCSLSCVSLSNYRHLKSVILTGYFGFDEMKFVASNMLRDTLQSITTFPYPSYQPKPLNSRYGNERIH